MLVLGCMLKLYLLLRKVVMLHLVRVNCFDLLQHAVFGAGQRSFEMNITVPLFMYDSEWGIMGLINGE